MPLAITTVYCAGGGKVTGHYYLKTTFTHQAFAPEGALLRRNIYRGSTLGSWLADITASAMVFFSISGLWLFFAPRIKKIKRAVTKIKPAPLRQDP